MSSNLSNKGGRMVHYGGRPSKTSRGKRRKFGSDQATSCILELQINGVTHSLEEMNK